MKTLGVLIFLLGILSITSAATVEACTLDLGLLVDQTKSIRKTNIPHLKLALGQLVMRFDVSTAGTHISFATFTKRGRLHNKFKDATAQNKTALVNLIDRKLKNLDSPTRIDRAINLVNHRMFTKRSGLRPGVEKALVMFTDGKSHKNTLEFYADALAMKMRGIRIVVVAIGPKARKQEYQDVLFEIGGENVIFLKDYASLDEHTNDILRLICPPVPCEHAQGYDIAFLLDRTKSLSMGDVLQMNGFISQLLPRLNISSERTHIAIIIFGKHARVVVGLNEAKFHNVEALDRFMQNGIPNGRASRTRIDKGLVEANNKVFVENFGDRPEFPNVLVLITDGKTHPDSAPFPGIVSSLKDKNVHLVAVGVGDYESFEGQLGEIAGRNVHTTNTFDRLSDLFDAIIAETCSGDGRFSRWSIWSECSVTCGHGFEKRTRTCTNPPPRGPYGADCEGPREETRACVAKSCPKY